MSGGGTGVVSFNAAGQAVPMGSPSATDFSGGAAGGGAWNTLAAHIMSGLSSNPGAVLGAGVLGLDMIMGNKNLPADNQVEANAASDQSMGRTLTAYEESGTLPAGLQSVVDANTNAGIAKIKSNYAQLGFSGSTMEAEAVAQVKQAATSQVAAIAQQLAQQGMQWSGLSQQEFNTLLQTQMAQEQGLQSAIGNFAGALAGARTKISES